MPIIFSIKLKASVYTFFVLFGFLFLGGFLGFIFYFEICFYAPFNSNMCQVSFCQSHVTTAVILSNRKTDIIVQISQCVLLHYATASGYNLRLLLPFN